MNSKPFKKGEEQEQGGFQRLHSSQDFDSPSTQPFSDSSSQPRMTVSLDQLSRLDPTPKPSTGLRSCLKKPPSSSTTTSASTSMSYNMGGQSSMATGGSKAVQEMFANLSQSMITNETDAHLAKQVTDTLSQALKMYESKQGGDRPEPGFGEPPRNRGALLPPPAAPFGSGYSRM